MKRTAFLLLLALFLVCGCDSTSRKEIRSEADLPGSKIGVISGTIYDIELTKRNDINLVRFPSLPECIVALKQGRIDAFPFNEITVNNELRREHGMRMAFRTDNGHPVGQAFRKDDQELASAMTALLRELRATGELDRMTDKWINADDYSAVPMCTDGTPAPEGKPIRLGISVNMAPFAFTAGKSWRGIEVELLEMLGRRLGRPVEVKYLDFHSMVPALQAGSIDVMGGCIFITEERKKELLFSEPYLFCYEAYFVLGEELPDDKTFWSGTKDSFNNNLLVENRWLFLMKGLKVTLEITIFSLLFGTLLGVGLYMLRKSKRRWANAVATAYSGFMRGIPMVVLLMILFYVIFKGFNAVAVAVIAFSMSFAGFAASMLDTSINSVGSGQMKAGIALGFSKWQTFRYIIGPQALKRALPHFKSEAISLVKNTSIVGYIAIQDITRACDMIRSRTFEAFFPLLLVTVIYFILTWLVGKFIEWLFKIGMKI